MKDLIERCIRGDKEASSRLVEDHSLLVRSAIVHAFQQYSYRFQEEELDDLHNGFFLFLMENDWRRLRSFKGNSRLSTYIRVIAVRYAIAYLRGQKGTMHPDSENILQFSESGLRSQQETLEQREREKIMLRCIQALSVQDQFLLKLSYDKDLTPNAICRILKISSVAYYNRKSRLIKKLKECARNHGI